MARTALALVALGILLLPAPARAAHYSRYPSATEEPPLAASRTRSSAVESQREPASPGGPATEADAEAGGAEGEDGASADEEASEEPELPPGLLGDALHGNDCIGVEYVYTGEVFTNMRGGISTNGATEYLGLIDLAVTARLDKMGVFPGGTVFVLGENSHGKGITDNYVGDVHVISDIDPQRPLTQVTEYWWQRALCDDLIVVRLGKQDANTEFAVLELGGDYMHSSFGLHHNIPMPTWPETSMGAVGLFQLTGPLAFKAAVFDGVPDGQGWGFSGTGVAFSIYEFERVWTVGRRPGEAHVGMWYHSGPWTDLRDEDVEHAGNHGVYMGLDQMLWMESERDDAQGLGVLFQYAWSAEDVSEVPNFWGAGMVYRGLIPTRDEDVTGAGVACSIFNGVFDDYRPETAVELFHKFQLSPYIFVEPDIQFIASPGGVERDAFVAGVRFEALL